VTSNTGRGGRRTAPYVFTEQGVAMLSSVLGSARAIAVHIEIMRTFVRVRALISTHQDLAKRLSELEEKTELLDMRHDSFSRNMRNQLRQVFDAIKALMTAPDSPKRPIPAHEAVRCCVECSTSVVQQQRGQGTPIAISSTRLSGGSESLGHLLRWLPSDLRKHQ
jgi:hypothetical protein